MFGGRADRHVRARLATGEEVLSAATVSPPGAIESFQAKPVRVVVTSQRLLVFKAGWLTTRNTGRLLWQTQMKEISDVTTSKRHPPQGLGVTFLDVQVRLTDGSTLTFVSSGLGVRSARRLAAAIVAALERSREQPHLQEGQSAAEG